MDVYVQKSLCHPLSWTQRSRGGDSSRPQRAAVRGGANVSRSHTYKLPANNLPQGGRTRNGTFFPLPPFLLQHVRGPVTERTCSALAPLKLRPWATGKQPQQVPTARQASPSTSCSQGHAEDEGAVPVSSGPHTATKRPSGHVSTTFHDFVFSV